MRDKLFITLFFLFSDFVYAQCAMCRAVLESSENEGMAEGINNGIVYLAFLPYLLVFFMIFCVYYWLRKDIDNKQPSSSNLSNQQTKYIDDETISLKRMPNDLDKDNWIA